LNRKLIEDEKKERGRADLQAEEIQKLKQKVTEYEKQAREMLASDMRLPRRAFSDDNHRHSLLSKEALSPADLSNTNTRAERILSAGPRTHSYTEHEQASLQASSDGAWTMNWLQQQLADVATHVVEKSRVKELSGQVRRCHEEKQRLDEEKDKLQRGGEEGEQLLLKKLEAHQSTLKDTLRKLTLKSAELRDRRAQDGPSHPQVEVLQTDLAELDRQKRSCKQACCELQEQLDSKVQFFGTSDMKTLTANASCTFLKSREIA
jgi:hypothetical protein